VGSEETRQHKRHRVHLSVRYVKADRFLRDYAEDLSKGGLFIAGAHHLEPLEEVEIDIDLPGLGTFRVLAETAHVVTPERAEKLGRRPGAGLAITRCDKQFRDALHEYLERLGHRADRRVLVGDQACAVVLGETGYQVAPAPPPAELAAALAASQMPVVGVVVPRAEHAAYAAAAAVVGAGDIVLEMDHVEEIDNVLTLLDVALP
jgi:hypothetical protein